MGDEIKSWFVAGTFLIGFATVMDWASVTFVGVPIDKGWWMITAFVAGPVVFHSCLDPLIRYYGHK